jgi:hypothetical protein
LVAAVVVAQVIEIHLDPAGAEPRDGRHVGGFAVPIENHDRRDIGNRDSIPGPVQ